MGVDASLFLEKSKQYYDFDRLSNIHRYWSIRDDIASTKADDLYANLVEHQCGQTKLGLTMPELIQFLEYNLHGWRSEKADAAKANRPAHRDTDWYDSHINSIKAMIKLAQDYPDEIFVVRADNEEGYYDLFEQYGGLYKKITKQYYRFESEET